MKQDASEVGKGVAYGLSAYLLWGSFPLYFALFDGIPAFEVLVHRVIWSCGFLVILISLLGRWSPVKVALQHPKELGYVFGCAVCIGINWGVYIYAVEIRQVLQASLGYFLTPLVSVALGLVVLRERISRLQMVAVVIALSAILLQLFLLGFVPWITLVLAFSFGIYSLFRKKVVLDGLSGLFVETLLLLPAGLLALAWLGQTGDFHFTGGVGTALLLVSSGAVTTIPLLLFAGSARRLKLATIGLLMYITPSIQFMVAVFVFNEPLTAGKLFSFMLIWVALAIYSSSTWLERARTAVT